MNVLQVSDDFHQTVLEEAIAHSIDRYEDILMDESFDEHHTTIDQVEATLAALKDLNDHIEVM